MRVLLAPDSYKGSLTAVEAAAAMAAGVARLGGAVEVDPCPIADGGEGFVEAMRSAAGGTRHEVTARGPRGEPVRAVWAELPGGTGVVELAAASGLLRLPDTSAPDPERATTYGTGQLIAAAAETCRRVVVGLGGSATNDGGAGLAQAVGVAFYGPGGTRIEEPMTGGHLATLTRIDPGPARGRLAGVELLAAGDVTNPLTGPEGASAVYGPQKGATPAQVERLDAGLRRYAELLRRQVGTDVEHVPGAGAAGGAAAGLLALLGAELRPGVGLVLEAVGFDRRVRGCGLCLTGEGRLDGQSLSGKAVLGVARAAAVHGVPTVALVGGAAADADRCLDAGLAGYRVIGAGLPLEASIRRAAELLADHAEACVAEVSAG